MQEAIVATVCATIAAFFAVLLALGRIRRDDTASQSNLTAALAKLAKIDADKADGTLTEAGAGAARSEALRILLRTPTSPAHGWALQWSEMPRYAALTTIAAFAFVAIAGYAIVAGWEGAWPSTAVQLAQSGGAIITGAPREDDVDIKALKEFVGSLDASPSNRSEARGPNMALPAVETMIERLARRLESAPDDIKGWRTLGWAHLNTGNYAEAIRAYQRAVALDPNDTDSSAGLSDAKERLAALGAPSGATTGEADAGRTSNMGNEVTQQPEVR